MNFDRYFHIYLKKKWFDAIEKKKKNQVKPTDESKVKVKGIDKVKIKIYDNCVKVFDVIWVMKFFFKV